MIKKEKTKEYIIMLLYVIVLSAIFGFIYEVLFYKINDGTFGHRGTLYGPWIPIYGYGGLFITLIAYRFKEKPLLVLLISALVSAVLEFTVGYLLFHISGTRLWDYNTEIWNFGNIGGYVCFRSITFFAVSGLFLIYVVIPFIKYLKKKLNKKVYNTIGILLGSLFFLDFIISNIF